MTNAQKYILKQALDRLPHMPERIPSMSNLVAFPADASRHIADISEDLRKLQMDLHDASRAIKIAREEIGIVLAEG